MILVHQMRATNFYIKKGTEKRYFGSLGSTLFNFFLVVYKYDVAALIPDYLMVKNISFDRKISATLSLKLIQPT